VQGVDYVLVDGKLKMPEGSSLTYIPEDVYWAKGAYDVYTYRDGVKHITYAAGVDGMPKYQVAVTYKHASTSPVTVEDRSASFKNLIKKLENGEDVTIVFYGDSITEGWDSSLRGIYGQRQPHWPALVTQYLAYTYGYNIKYVSNALKGVFNYPKAKDSFGERGTIYYINTAVGGWKVGDAFANYQNYVLKPAEKYGGADIIFYAFGMNDSSLHPLDYKYAVNKTMEKILDVTPNTPIVLVSSMLPNTESVNGTGKIAQQEEQLYVISEAMKEKGFAVEVAPMTRVHTHICSVKRYRDHSGNNMNHPGDYTHRVYAQVALQTVLGYAK
jgi:lysophospholipase L1-like esterase